MTACMDFTLVNILQACELSAKTHLPTKSTALLLCNRAECRCNLQTKAGGWLHTMHPSLSRTKPCPMCQAHFKSSPHCLG